MTPNIDEIIREHVSLEVRCLDGSICMPICQAADSGGLCYFLRDHLGYPIPSPALFKPMHDRFTTAVSSCGTHEIRGEIRARPGKDGSPMPTARAHQTRGRRAARPRPREAAVVQSAEASGPQGGVTFDFSRQWVATRYYFYVHDASGAGVRQNRHLSAVSDQDCLNGHEWVKQQLRRHRIVSRVSTTAFSRVRIPRLASDV